MKGLENRLTVVFLEKILRRMQLPSVVTTPRKDRLRRIAAMTFMLKMLMHSDVPYLKKLCMNMKRSQSLVPVLQTDRQFSSIAAASGCVCEKTRLPDHCLLAGHVDF